MVPGVTSTEWSTMVVPERPLELPGPVPALIELDRSVFAAGAELLSGNPELQFGEHPSTGWTSNPDMLNLRFLFQICIVRTSSRAPWNER